MTPTQLIVIGAVVLAVLLVALVVGLVLARRRRIDMTKKEELDKPKAGGYQADGGFNLSTGGGTAVKEPVERSSVEC